MSPQNDKKSFSFEESVKKLDTIVHNLEKGNIDQLEEMLKLFEDGSVLLKKCYEYLEKAEMKVETISKNLNTEKRDNDES
ncbi:MAG TPA: exodeoxyribonuclease VII small subunit [Candidatus Cloacimonadota bacterium]|jgi:exodeoxyribonuclease VII small subunit|nr:exodeoxyribonuclease VII small subunit [Candidatus Cloacimonadota bacterium]HPM01020.1 exodeoxyribonuclease VII small subunit [Candidatus Cloacimonadota bacterium]